MSEDDKMRQAQAGQHNATLLNQAEGDTRHAGQQGFSGNVAGESTRSPEQMQGQSQSGAEGHGDVGRGAFQGGQGASQQTFAQQGEADQQRFGLTSDQIGQNQQSYGQSVEQDTTGGQGAGEAHLASAGSSGVLGEGPGQSQGQPASPTTGGPSFAGGLRDTNKS